jgi:glycosyltransferase involved in cell wall biosynthesis
MTDRDRIVVVAPWYPVPARPYDGSFVADSVAALRAQGAHVSVVHLVNTATQPLTRVKDVVQVPFDAPAGTSRAEMSRRQAAALREQPDLFADATAVHAHVGIPTGAAVAEVLPPPLPLVVTEHATYLATELTYPAGRRLYRHVLDRAHRVLAVSEVEARRIRAAFPDRRDRVLAAGNPVRSIGSAPERRSDARDRWLYVGNLIERKGVHQLLAAFARWAADHPTATLTLAGGGADEPALRAQARELGLAERIRFLGPVAPAELGPVLDAADVLVHLSRLETFGMTVVEAAMAGLPVVVTRCGGPEQVLARAAEVGLAQLIPVRASSADVVAAVARISAADADTAAAVRRELEDSYGIERFGARLLATLRGGEERNAGRRVILVAGSPIGHERLVRLSTYALARGLRITAFVTDPAEAVQLDPRIDVVDLGRALRWMPHHVLDAVLLDALPGTILERLATAVDHPSRWRGRTARLLGRTRARHRKVTAALRHRAWHPAVYGFVDPWLSTRIGRDAIERAVAGSDAALVVATDLESRPTARLIADLLPAVRVTGVPSLSELAALAE